MFIEPFRLVCAEFIKETQVERCQRAVGVAISKSRKCNEVKLAGSTMNTPQTGGLTPPRSCAVFYLAALTAALFQQSNSTIFDRFVKENQHYESDDINDVSTCGRQR